MNKIDYNITVNEMSTIWKKNYRPQFYSAILFKYIKFNTLT